MRQILGIKTTEANTRMKSKLLNSIKKIKKMRNLSKKKTKYYKKVFTSRNPKGGQEKRGIAPKAANRNSSRQVRLRRAIFKKIST